MPGHQQASGALRALLVDHDRDEARRLEELLRAAWPGPVEMLHASRLADAERQLAQAAVSCVLVDLALPDAPGLDALRRLRLAAPEPPIVVLADPAGEHLAIEALHRGAQDRLVRGRLSGPLLAQAVRHAIERRRRETELETRDELARAVLDAIPADLAVVDGGGRIVTVNQAWALHAAERGGTAHADVGADYLAVSERAGGPSGPDAARAAAGLRAVLSGESPRFQLEYRAGDQRYELHVWRLPSGRGGAVVSHVAVDLLAAYQQPAGRRLWAPPGGRPTPTGEEPAARAARRAASGRGLLEALRRHQLRLFYQPAVALDSGQVVGFEALLRWLHPDLGLIEPEELVPLAEERGMMGAVGRWVLRQACGDAAGWAAARPGREPPRLLVNLSPAQLADPGLRGQVEDALAASGLDPATLCLEISEHAIVGDVGLAARALGSLKEAGVRLAIDDFGAGYTSLSHLRHFPVDLLKIDRSLIAGLGERPEDRAIVGALVSLAHGLGIQVAAEGVEAPLQLAELRRLGCDLAQGFLFAAPRAAEIARGLLDEAFEVD